MSRTGDTLDRAGSLHGHGAGSYPPYVYGLGNRYPYALHKISCCIGWNIAVVQSQAYEEGNCTAL